ncbi:MAG TPA: ABC transporter substrate-binding protein [Chloroflexota bacterium]|nr:ABC transporter substrate-binding protein [Chloroflexota bacterium]
MGTPSRLIASVFLFVLAASCGAPSPSTPAAQSQAQTGASTPKRITIAIKGDPPTLSDKINSAGSGGVPGVSEVQRLVQSGLAVPDDTGTLQPLMAEAVPSTANGFWRVLPDGRMETTWRIRDGAHWHDGAPFTADDLVFTATVGQDRELPQFADRAFSFLEGLDVVDDRTVTARWSRPYIEADAMFTELHALPLPRHLLEQAYTDNKAGFVELPYWTRDFVGTGPYRVREWEGGSHLIVSADERYPLGRPKIDEIEVKFIPDPNTMLANLMAGAVDLTMGRGLALEQAQTVQAQRSNIRMDVAVDGCLCAFPQYLNPNPPVIADVAFRRALLYALDRKELANSLEQGLVPPAEIFIGPNQPEFRNIQSAIVHYDHDPRRAAQLIESLGFVRGGDGFFHDPTGQRLSVEMRTTPGVETGKNLVFAVADAWQEAGIGAEPMVIPPQLATDREWRANFPGYDMVNQPSNLTLLQRFLGRESSLPENQYRGNNRMRYASPELDAIIERYFVTVPWDERMDVARQAVHHITDLVVNTSLLYNTTITLSNANLSGPTATNNAWNAHTWDLG